MLVRLNVGGVKYTTTQSTLTKYDSFLKSLVEHYVEGDCGIICDEKGRIFIDRNGKQFKYVLEFLRSDIIFSYEKEFLAEAEFYQIKPLIKALQEKPKIRESPQRGVQAGVVEFNIGGRIYTVSLENIRKTIELDGCREGYLRDVIHYMEDSHRNNGRFMFDEEGRFFVDRCGKSFDIIYKFLQYGIISQVCSDEFTINDSHFYLGYHNNPIERAVSEARKYMTK